MVVENVLSEDNCYLVDFTEGGVGSFADVPQAVLNSKFGCVDPFPARLNSLAGLSPLMRHGLS